MSAFTEKQIKAAKKEGGKKGQDLAGMFDMGGVRYAAAFSSPPSSCCSTKQRIHVAPTLLAHPLCACTHPCFRAA